MTSWAAQKIKVGALSATVLPLGEITDDLRGWFPPGTLAVPDGRSRLPINCLHVAGPGLSVLIDACDPQRYPDFEHTGDSMVRRLERAGISPSHVSHVLLTHGHHDHFCGVTGTGNRPIFPNARHILSPQDWSNGTLTPEAQQADGLAADASPLKGLFRMGLLDLGESAVPLPQEICLIDAPGETKGHRVVRLSSGGEVLYFLADLFHVPAEIHDPSLCPLWADQLTLKASRSQIVADMRRENARFLCSHISGVFAADIFSTHPSNFHEALK